MASTELSETIAFTVLSPSHRFLQVVNTRDC
jgi:hypothetical protein